MRDRRWARGPRTCAQVALCRLEQNLRQLQRPTLPADAALQRPTLSADAARRPARRRARA